jgi:MFS family permease
MKPAQKDTVTTLREPTLLRQRPFRLLYVGQTSSVIGDAIVPIALAFAVLDLTGSASVLGIVLAARIVPTVVLLLMGGVIADRVGRRSLMLVCDVTRFCSQLLLGTLLLTGHASITTMIVLQLVAGTAAAFFQPAATGLLAEVVAPGDLQRANGMMGLSENTAWTLGPAIGGILVSFVSPGAALMADGLTYGISGVALYLLRLPAKPRGADGPAPSMIHELREGWQEFRSRTWLWTLVAWCGGFHLLVLPAWQVFGPSVSRAELGGAPAWAVITTCAGLGSIIGGIIALRMRPRYILRASFIPLGLYGLQLLALAVAAPVPLIGAAALVSNIGLSMFNVFMLTAMQQNVPLAAMSRVSSYEWLGSIGLLPVGQALIGPAALVTSPTTMLIAGAVWMFCTPVLLYAVRSARDLRAVSESVPDAPDAWAAAVG